MERDSKEPFAWDTGRMPVPRRCIRSVVSSLCLFLISVFVAGLCLGEDGAAASAPAKAIAIARIGIVDETLFRRVSDYVAKQYETPVNVKHVPSAVDTNATDPTVIFASSVNDADVCLLVLAGSGASTGRELSLSPDRRIAVLDTVVLKPTHGDTPEGIEQYGQRLEKESLRAIALVLGMPDCPSPRCALLRHRNDEELDLKPRTPCPPCLIKIRAKLDELGASSAGEKP
jgi:hypothetical protein